MILPAITILYALGLVDARPRYNRNVQATPPACPSGMHIVTTRGTIEEPGHGAMQALVDGYKDIYPGSDDFAIDYPAEGVTPPETPGGDVKFDLAKYQVSEAQGYAALKSHLETYVEQCEDTKILLLGYSQGAHVVGDVLCGNTNFFAGPYKAPINSGYTFNVKGVIALGDPANIAGLPWHQGSSSHSGMFLRTTYGSCGPLYTGFGQSWCDDNDFFCDFTQNPFNGSIPVHLRYVLDHKEEIFAQTKKLIEDSEKEDGSSKFISQVPDL